MTYILGFISIGLIFGGVKLVDTAIKKMDAESTEDSYVSCYNHFANN